MLKVQNAVKRMLLQNEIQKGDLNACRRFGPEQNCTMHCWVEQPRLGGYFVYLIGVKILYFLLDSKLGSLLSPSGWHVSCLPDRLMASCGCSPWIQLFGDVRNCWILGTGDQMDCESDHTSLPSENLQPKFPGKPSDSGVRKLIFSSCLKEQRKVWTRETAAAVEWLMSSCWW